MIRTDVELVAIKAATRGMGEAVGQIGYDRPPSSWSPGEARAVAVAALDAYRKEFWRLSGTEIPF